MNKKKRDSVGSNYAYIYKELWNYDKRPFFFSFMEVIFRVAAPLGLAVIPSIVIALLEQQVGLASFTKVLILTFAIYGTVAALNGFLTDRNKWQFVAFRCSRLWSILYRKCMTMDYSKFEEEGVREKMQKACNAIGGNHIGVEGFLHKNTELAVDILGIIVYALIITTVHPLIIVLLILLAAIQMLFYKKAVDYEQTRKDDMAKLEVTQYYLGQRGYDTSTGKDARMYHLDQWIRDVFCRKNRELKSIRGSVQSHYYYHDLAMLFLQFLRDGICYGYLIYMLFHGMQAAAFVLYLGVIGGFSNWIANITAVISEIGKQNKMIGEYREFMDMEDEFHHGEGQVLEATEESLDVVFEHVSFHYSEESKNVLEDVSFHIKPGEKLALVGINGAGKTTIVKLLCGFYKPVEGRVLINGKDTRDLNVDEYFKQIAVVFQEAFTLSFTLEENVSGCEKGMERSKVEQAIEKAGLLDKVNSLSKGLDTYLNKELEEDGIQLSGGELQKLMLARAVYKNARFLILDEPTAALDALAESEMYEKYDTILNRKTSLFISHRLASTKFCNTILFLENGKIKEQGTHQELMEQHGSYAQMFEVQSQYYKEGGMQDEETVLA
ncbi:MAG: ABC transporter ATP-binding protein [Lachnospiraceae bacterium]